MMLSKELHGREYEISGLKRMEVRMYDLAWEHNKDRLGFTGLVNLWFMEISPHITLVQVWRVWNRLIEYSYFNTNAYLGNPERVNDYVPNI